MSNLPTFLVIGAPRAGTTSLQSALSRHPDVFLAPKELHFFMRAADGSLPPPLQDRDVPADFDAYAQLFAGADDYAAIGEISPGYLSVLAARRIKAALPDVRIVCILRHPVDQARSYLATRIGRQPSAEELALALDADPELVALGRSDYPLAVYYRLFGADRIKVVLFEEMIAHPERVLGEIQDFIGVPRRPLSLPRHNASSAWLMRLGWLTAPLKRWLPGRAVRPLAYALHQLQALTVSTAQPLPAVQRAALLHRYYGRVPGRLEALGIRVAPWGFEGVPPSNQGEAFRCPRHPVEAVLLVPLWLALVVWCLGLATARATRLWR